jgi:hypothetical protein
LQPRAELHQAEALHRESDFAHSSVTPSQSPTGKLIPMLLGVALGSVTVRDSIQSQGADEQAFCRGMGSAGPGLREPANCRRAGTMKTVVLLIISNLFMNPAWYGHLKFKHHALWLVILASWGLALLEYIF